MIFAELSGNTTRDNTLLENSNNGSANATIQSNETANSTNTTRWISLGPIPIPRATQSNETANNSITATTDAGTKGVQTIEKAADLAIAEQMSGSSENKTTGEVILRPITKEEARRAEQEANIMIKAYIEKVEQEKREKAVALATAQANQTAQSIDGIEKSQDDTAAAPEETETAEEEEDQEDEEGDENENSNDEEK
jgi:hypothetical protein